LIMVKRFNIWTIVLLLIMAIIFCLSLRKIYDTDIGFHLRGGEWMLKNRSFHHYDRFTYTVPHHEYIAMYWLYQIILFFIFKFFSDGMITISNSILILLFFALIYLRLSKFSIPIWLICILILTSVFSFEIRFGVRPEIFTYIFMTLMLFILDLYYFHKKNLLFLLPVIQLLWVNLHGLFILGWAILFCYLISIFFHEKKKLKELLKWSIISIIVSLFNPYHIKGILFPFYLFTRLQNSSVFKDAITEFASPFSARGFLLTSHSALFIYFIFLFLSIFVLIITKDKRKIHEYLLFFAFGYLSTTAVRNIPIFMVIAIHILGTGFKDLIPVIKKILRIPKSLENSIAIAISVFSFLFILHIINNGYYASRGGGNFGIGFDTEFQPIRACEFIVKNNLKGKILNDINRGSWLIWAVREPVYIDGRLEVMKETLFEEFHNSHHPGGIVRLIEKYKPDLIIFDYSYPEALFWDIDLENLPDWTIIYLDETSVIYARDGYGEQFKPFNFSKVIQNLGIDTIFDEQKIWSILRKQQKSNFKLFFESLYRKQTYPVSLTRLAFYTSVKLDFTTAEILYLNAIKRSEHHLAEIYFRLGLIYHFMEKLDKAEYCYRRVLSENPGHRNAKEMLNRLKQGVPPVG